MQGKGSTGTHPVKFIRSWVTDKVEELAQCSEERIHDIAYN